METYKRAIYTYWNPKKDGTGFASIKDFLSCFALSVHTSLKHFEDVEVYTDDYGKSIIEKLELPIKINTALNELKDLEPEFWGYAKIFTYSLQRKPFVHIDCDVILWDGIPPHLNECDMIFQNVEPYDVYKLYFPLSFMYGQCPVRPIKINREFAYNCGILASRNFDVLKKWEEVSREYLTKNKEYIFSRKDMLIHQNILHEQVFIASITSGLNVGVLFEETDLFKVDFTNGYKYTHLWSTSKRNRALIEKINTRLFNEYKHTFNLINS